VASKNTKNGEMPAPRTALAFRLSEPLEPVQDALVGGGVELTVTVADWVALPPAPVHVSENFVVVVRAEVVLAPLMA
jgi:hypothetical protein